MAGLSDDHLELLLRAAVEELDPVPPDVIAAGESAFGWRTIDAELAELTFDSFTQSAAVRAGAGGPRLLSWRRGDLEIELQVAGGDRGVRLIGQVLVEPSGVPPTSIELCRPGEVVELALDEWGRFECADLASGLVRLRLRGAPTADSVIVTEWTRV